MDAGRAPFESYSSPMTNLTNTNTLCLGLFEMGIVSSTPQVLDLAESEQINLLHLLARHASGDWGDLGVEDCRSNEEALKSGARLFSSYRVGEIAKVWIITDAETTACGPCWTGQGECRGGGHVEYGTHFLDGQPHRLTTTILRPDDY